MTNMLSSFPIPPSHPPLHQHGGRLSSMTGELSIHRAGDDFSVEGNGTIRSLPTTHVGTTVFLRILNSPTFVNSKNLVCPNGVDYVASPGDLVIARSDGDAVWRLFVIPASGEPLADRSLSLSTAQQARVLKNIGVAQCPIINGTIVESHASGAETFAIKTLAGNDPSATDPVCAIFGDGVQISITAALSVTIPATGTMGTTSGVAFRLWLALINDGGTARLGVRNCSDASGVYGFPGDGLIISTIITSPNAAGVTYTNVAVTLPQFIIAGFADYESGQATAGTWAASPTRIHMFGPHMKKPGDTVQEIYFANSSNTTTTSSTPQATGLSKAITPNSVCNPVTIDVRGSVYTSNAANSGVTAHVTRGGSNIGTAMIGGGGSSGAQNSPYVSAIAFDRPASTSPVTYTVKVNNGDNATSVEWNHNVAETDMILYEMMG